MIDILILLLGLGLILVGANALTDGASAVAKRFGISDLVIGLTIVAIGTSAPELVVSVTAALNGSAELALGNVVGSNVFNILAIVGGYPEAETTADLITGCQFCIFIQIDPNLIGFPIQPHVAVHHAAVLRMIAVT